jgi:hypothetical protein
MDPRHDRQLAARAQTLSSLTFLLTGPLRHAHPGDEHQQQRFDIAMARYDRCHWNQAFTLLSQLADEGHVQSARIGLLMHAHGPTMYGFEFDATDARRERWIVTAAPALRQVH